MPQRRAELALFIALTVVTPGIAHAQGPRVYIVSVPMDDNLDAIATRAGAAARAALRNIDGVDWQHPDQRFLGYDDSALSVLARAREQLDAGRQAYLQLELDQAIEQLVGAVENFDAAAAALEDPGDLGQALLFLGASHAFNDQRRQALEVFGRLHRQMPFIAPDPDTFPPDVVTLYQQARPRDAVNPQEMVSIDSNPPGAIAYVDFLARGRTPLNVSGLTQGDHIIRVTRPGATPFVETLTVRRRRAGTSNAYLVDNPDLEELNGALNGLRDASVDELGSGPIATVATILEVDKIGLIRVSEGDRGQVSLELLLFDVASGRRLVRGEGEAPTTVGEFEIAVSRAVTTAFEAALRSENQAGDDESIPAVQGGNGEGSTASGPSTPVTEEAWFWILIGAVVAGGIAAAIAIPLATQGPALGQDPGGQVVFRF